MSVCHQVQSTFLTEYNTRRCITTVAVAAAVVVVAMLSTTNDFALVQCKAFLALSNQWSIRVANDPWMGRRLRSFNCGSDRSSPLSLSVAPMTVIETRRPVTSGFLRVSTTTPWLQKVKSQTTPNVKLVQSTQDQVFYFRMHHIASTEFRLKKSLVTLVHAAGCDPLTDRPGPDFQKILGKT